MPAAPLHPKELLRKSTLDALEVLDTLPEAFTDAVSCAAAAIANVPISAISLVDTERQWFKGSCGLDVKETSRDVSFCAYAILTAEPFLVPDARSDPRFSDNPMVTGAPFIRAYAGFPIVVHGQPIGALCVIDDRPRHLSKSQIDQLSRLAAGTGTWLQERQSLEVSLSRTKAELRYVTFNDTVTGLPNRLLFQGRLKLAALRCDHQDTSLAVLCIDMDGFKASAGQDQVSSDAAVFEIGRRLLGLVSPADTVARVGADQFLILTDSPGEGDAIARLATRIGSELAKPIGTTCLTASVGVSLYPSDGTYDRLVSNADTAMIAAKRAGGNRHCFFENRMDRAMRDRLELLESLRGAVERRELELYYQPKIHARSGQVTGAEALLRWHHPQRGMVSPAVFIPLAESSGLINALGQWVIVEACRQMGQWRDAGIQMRVAINLSVHQLRLPNLAQAIESELTRNHLESSLLTCEITESVAMDDAVDALNVFEQLKSIGVRLSIDDFGTGYSSLSYLRRMPVHQLKIDRSFVTDLAESGDARAIAAAIIDLAHALRLEVVAEGVETIEQRDILLSLRCDKFQGFLFAKPMTSDAFTGWALDHGGRGCRFRPSIFAAG